MSPCEAARLKSSGRRLIEASRLSCNIRPKMPLSLALLVTSNMPVVDSFAGSIDMMTNPQGSVMEVLL